MKITDEIEVKVGADGIIALREPTNKEWNHFASEQYPLSKRGAGAKNNATIARANLFDKIVVRIDNIEDDKGPITVETKDRLPNRIKSSVILNAFEMNDDAEVEVKNS